MIFNLLLWGRPTVCGRHVMQAFITCQTALQPKENIRYH